MKIIWSYPAEKDLDDIYNYISKDSVFYAKRFIEKIFRIIENLRKFPYIGKIVSETKDRNIREVIYYHYRIIYKIEDDKIFILSLIHSARNFENLHSEPWEIK